REATHTARAAERPAPRQEGEAEPGLRERRREVRRGDRPGCRRLISGAETQGLLRQEDDRGEARPELDRWAPARLGTLTGVELEHELDLVDGFVVEADEHVR